MGHTLLSLSLASIIAFAPALARASDPLHDYSSLDFQRTEASGTILFVPFLSSDASFEKGVTFYKSYFNDIQTPVVWAPGVKSIEVFVLPTAHSDNASEYNEFFSDTTLVDAQEHWFTSELPCSLSSEFDVFTYGFPEDLLPQVRTAGYPQVCSVTIFYRTVQENALLALLQSNRGIVIKDELPLCTSASPVFSTKPIVIALVKAHALKYDPDGNLVGKAFTVWKSLLDLVHKKPTLFGGASAAQEGANAFLRYAIDVDEKTLQAMLRQDYADTRMTACIPAPLDIHYGE